MDNRLLIGFGGFLAVFLLFPFVAQLMREGSVGSDSTITAANEGGPAVPQSRVPSDPPLLNAQNLVGTEWSVEWENYKIKITVAANGVLYATHPLMRSVTGLDYFEGRWTINYDKVFLEARFGDQYFSADLIISGNDLYEPNGNKISRY